MRVLMVTGSFPPMRCGVGDYTAALVAALAQEPGMELAVLTSVGAGPMADGGCRVHAVMRSWGLNELALFVRTVNRFAPDVVHVQYPTQGYGRGRMPFLLPWMTRLLGRDVVVTWHEPVPSSLRGSVAVLLALAARAIVVVRSNFVSLIGRWQALIVKSKPMHFIANAPSIPAVRLSVAEVEAVRAQHRVGVSRRLVVFFGFLLPSKGVEFLFPIADRTRDHLLIIGDDIPGGDFKKELRARATAEGWEGCVTFAGFLSPLEVSRALAAADAVVLPYRQGAGHWNTSIHAAQSQGTFLVTTSHTQIGDDAAYNTWWCAPDDLEAMRLALTSGLGRKVTPAKLTGWPDIAAQHVAVYRLVTGRA